MVYSEEKRKEENRSFFFHFGKLPNFSIGIVPHSSTGCFSLTVRNADLKYPTYIRKNIRNCETLSKYWNITNGLVSGIRNSSATSLYFRINLKKWKNKLRIGNFTLGIYYSRETFWIFDHSFHSSCIISCCQSTSVGRWEKCTSIFCTMNWSIVKIEKFKNTLYVDARPGRSFSSTHYYKITRRIER